MPDIWNSVDPGNIIRGHLLHHRVEIEYYAGTNNPKFVGWANPSALTTDPVWRIAMITYDASNNPLEIVWSGNTNQYLFKWSDRNIIGSPGWEEAGTGWEESGTGWSA